MDCALPGFPAEHFRAVSIVTHRLLCLHEVYPGMLTEHSIPLPQAGRTTVEPLHQLTHSPRGELTCCAAQALVNCCTAAGAVAALLPAG